MSKAKKMQQIVYNMMFFSGGEVDHDLPIMVIDVLVRFMLVTGIIVAIIKLLK